MQWSLASLTAKPTDTWGIVRAVRAVGVRAVGGPNPVRVVGGPVVGGPNPANLPGIQL